MKEHDIKLELKLLHEQTKSTEEARAGGAIKEISK